MINKHALLWEVPNKKRCLKFQIWEEERFSICTSVHLSISSTLSLLNAYKWAFILVGFCPTDLLSSGILS